MGIIFKAETIVKNLGIANKTILRNTLISRKILNARLEIQRFNLCQNYVTANVSRKQESGHDPKHTHQLIGPAWWRSCHGLGLHGCFWNRLIKIYS